MAINSPASAPEAFILLPEQVLNLSCQCVFEVIWDYVSWRLGAFTSGLNCVLDPPASSPVPRFPEFGEERPALFLQSPPGSRGGISVQSAKNKKRSIRRYRPW